MGIPFASAGTTVAVSGLLPRQPLPVVARLARQGDKHAQLELGIRFEEGRGVTRDLDKAEELYRRAANDSGGVIWVYSPPVGGGTRGRVIPVDSGPERQGLPEARRRLENAEGS